jgi:hypothetical protein
MGQLYTAFFIAGFPVCAHGGDAALWLYDSIPLFMTTQVAL